MHELVADQNRKSLVTLKASVRFISSGTPDASEFRPSLYTRNSSLPGMYSQRRRTLEFNVCASALNCNKLLIAMRGVGARTIRAFQSPVEKSPNGRSTQFNYSPGSIEKRDVTMPRPAEKFNSVFVPPP